MKFKISGKYVFFLSDIPPNLQLLEPQWKTASLVEDGQVTVGMPRGEKDSLQNRLQDFAQSKGYAIQSPDSFSPVWRNNINWLWVLSILILLSLLLYFIYLYKKRTEKF